MTIEAINNSTEGYYKSNLEKFGEGAQGVGWKNEDAQRIRFEQLVKVIDTKAAFSLNDLGCGVGDLALFLARHISIEFRYKGYDTFDTMISKSKVRFAERNNVQFFHILTSNEIEEEDYTLASGIFNIRMNISDNSWLGYILETINEMNKKSKKGFSFNALTKYSDSQFMRNELYYSDPLLLFDFCKKNFSKNVALLHDYGQYDFTILVRKE